MNALIDGLHGQLLKRKVSGMYPSARWRVTGGAAVAVILVLQVFSGVVLAFNGPYGGKLGFDISYPQCGQPTPSGAFAIVGVNGGRPFTSNTCFGTELASTAAVVGANNVSVYMNLSAPIGKTATQNTSGPLACVGGDKACQAHNYGWNAAAFAFNQAKASGYTATVGTLSQNWWLDVETVNSWSGRTDVNRGSIQGAIDYLVGQKLNVGIYSTSSMWNSITGGWSNNGHPVWYAGNSSTTCNVSSFTGGAVWVLQHSSGASTGDEGC